MANPMIIAIGASEGGVSALRTLVAELPEDFGVPILIVLHVGSQPSHLPDLLNVSGPLPAKHAEHNESILPGSIYVAPPDQHMTVADGRLRLSRGPKENCARPAVDPLFRSVAESYGPGAVGVILTGNLNDGTFGLFEITRRGGTAIAQEPGDAVCPSMPMNASRHVALDYCVPLSEMPKLLIDLVNGKDGKDKPMPVVSQSINIDAQSGSFERPVAITCPDCGGALHRTEVGTMTRFDCHIGHSYTAETMAVAQFDKMERMMRAAVRFLNERAEFCLQMAEYTHSLQPDVSASWQAASRQALDRAYRLRDLVEQDWITPEAKDLLAVADHGSSSH